MIDPRRTHPDTPSQGDRAAMMQRVRDALGHATTQPPSAPPRVDPSLVRLAEPSDDLPGMFERHATAVGMKVYRCVRASLPLKLGSILSLLDATSAVVGIGDWADTVDLAPVLKQHSVRMIDWQAEHDGPTPLEPQYAADVGITDVAAALAETGTLVIHPGPGRSRGHSLVPPAHVALLRTADILPDMIDYWPWLTDAEAALPSSQTFITGPSKTADIEGHLVTGVHGPGSVHILMCSDT